MSTSTDCPCGNPGVRMVGGKDWVCKRCNEIELQMRRDMDRRTNMHRTTSLDTNYPDTLRWGQIGTVRAAARRWLATH